MARIQERQGVKGTTYQVKYRIDGKDKTKSFASKREANKFKKEIEAQKTLGIAKDESNITFKEYANNVFEIRDRKATLNTKKNRQIYLNQINNIIGNKKLKDITPNYLDKYFLNLSKEKSNSVIERIKIVINIVMDSAFRKDLIVSNPMTKLDFKFRNEKNSDTKIVSIEDFNKLLDYASPKYYYYLLLVFYTGMRRGEALALTWKDIDYEKNTISINKSFNKFGQVTKPKTKSSIRKVLIHDGVAEVLYKVKLWQRNHKEFFGDQYQNNNLVICNEDGTYLTTNALNMFFRRANEKLGIKIRSHKLRHTFATMLRGMEAKDVQQLLGHKDIDVTVNTYQDHDKYLEKTIENINNIFNNIKLG